METHKHFLESNVDGETLKSSSKEYNFFISSSSKIKSKISEFYLILSGLHDFGMTTIPF